MTQLKVDERIYETSVTTGTGEYTLAGAVAGFQPVSVIGANNYIPIMVTDDINWERILGTFITGPNRLQRTIVLASSNGGAAVNWGAGTKKIRCDWPAKLAAPSVVTKSVAGGTDVTLTAAEQRCDILVLTGALTANINVIVDGTPWSWTIYNNTSGAYTATLKTSGGTGVAVAQGKRGALYCDGVNVATSLTDAALLGALPLTGGNLTGAANNAKSTVASATTPDIWTGTGYLIDYTGTATATGFAAAPQAGAGRELLCAGAAVFTSGANFVVAGGNFTAAAGDRILVIAETTTKFRLYPIKADGTAVAGSVSAATQAEQETGSSTSVYVSPGRQHFHPSALKLWGVCGVAGDLDSPSYNITSIGDTGAGRATVTIDTDFPSALYPVVAGFQNASSLHVYSLSHAQGSFVVGAQINSGAATDPVKYEFMAAGDQA